MTAKYPHSDSRHLEHFSRSFIIIVIIIIDWNSPSGTFLENPSRNESVEQSTAVNELLVTSCI